MTDRSRPDDRVTGEDPMTRAQASYLELLARQPREDPDIGDVTRAEASERMGALRRKAGVDTRGR